MVRKYVQIVQEAFQIYDKHLGDQTISVRSFGTVYQNVVILEKQYFFRVNSLFHSAFLAIFPDLISQVARALGHNPTRAELSELLVGKTQDDTFTLAEVSKGQIPPPPPPPCRIDCSHICFTRVMQWTVL